MADSSARKRDIVTEPAPADSRNNASNSTPAPRAKLPVAHPPLADFYNPIRSHHAQYEDSLLFDKVKRQMHSYLTQSARSPASTGALRLRAGSLARQTGRGGGRFARKSKQDVVKSIIASSLNEREKLLLKYLLLSEEGPVGSHIFLTRTLKRHLYKCLLKITMKIGVKSGLLDLVKKCHLVSDSLSVGQLGLREIGICEIFKVTPMRAAGSRVAGEAQTARARCEWGGFRTAERVAPVSGELQSVGGARSEPCACCAVVRVPDPCGLLEFAEGALLDVQARASAPATAALHSRSTKTLATVSAQHVLRIDLMFHSLEAMAAREPCCQQEIHFTYQPNPFNHLIHLYLGLRHQNN